ncbi:MAG: capsular biosynthesis protein [Firmicutes bacterium]|nr:capsular biosynthesis protein [Bacillota bacterium]
MIDLHSHILPETDDGAESFVESLEIIKKAEELGVKELIATPHYFEGVYNRNFEENMKTLIELNIYLKENDLNFKVYLGNEVYICPNIITLLEDKAITTLNNSRYLLMEFPMMDIPTYAKDIIYELKLRGIVPIIAHPERNEKIVENPNILYDFINMGVLAQLNLGSLVGQYGSKVRETAEILVEHNMIHFLGNDIHSSKLDFNIIDKGMRILKRKVGEEKFEEIKNTNAQLVLDDKPIDIEEPKRYVEKGRFKTLTSYFLNQIKRVSL